MAGQGSSRRTVMMNIGLAATMLALPRVAEVQATNPHAVPSKGDDKMVLGMLTFDGFQLLDVFGPLEMFGSVRDRIRIVLIAERAGPIASSAGPVVMADTTLANVPKLDILMIPGGGGTRREVNNIPLINTVKTLAQATPHVASICTGAALLARTGLLDGKRATTNKRAFKWAISQGPNVEWVRQARWVEDGKFSPRRGSLPARTWPWRSLHSCLEPKGRRRWPMVPSIAGTAIRKTTPSPSSTAWWNSDSEGLHGASPQPVLRPCPGIRPARLTIAVTLAKIIVKRQISTALSGASATFHETPRVYLTSWSEPAIYASKDGNAQTRNSVAA